MLLQVLTMDFLSFTSAHRLPLAGTLQIRYCRRVSRRGGGQSTMGIMDFIKGELLEVIEWTDDSRDTLSFRFPDDDKAIKNGAQLIVRESQVVQFVYLGEFGDTFGPGKHTLTTDNIPVLTKLKSWKYGFNSPFKADVYYVTTRLFTGNKWGTANPIMMRDDDFGIVRVARVRHLRLQDRRSEAVPEGSRRLGSATSGSTSSPTRCARASSASSPTRWRRRKIPVLDVATRYTELGEALLPLINPVVTAKYGLEIASFIVENVSVPPEVEQAIDKRSSMAAVGNLNDYVKFQMAQGHGEAGGGGAGGMASGAGGRLRHRAADDAAERRRRRRRPRRCRWRRSAARGSRGAGAARAAVARPTSPRRSACPKPT